MRWVDKPGSTFRPAVHGLRSCLDLVRVRWRLRTQPVGGTLITLPRTRPVTAHVSVPRQRVVTNQPAILGGLALDA